MTQDIQIGGRSRRFRIVVLLAALGIVFSAMVVVGAISETPGDIGVSLSPNDGGSGDGLLGGIPGGSGGSENKTGADGNASDGSSENQTGNGEFVNSTRGDGGFSIRSDTSTRDSLDALSTVDDFRRDSNQSVETDQFDVDGQRSFIQDEHFTVTTDRPQFWRVTTYDTFTGNAFIDVNPATPESTTVLPRSAADTGENTTTDVFELDNNASRLPSAGTPESIRIISGANPDAYEFRVAGDGTIIVTDGNGNIESLPAGTVYEVTATDRQYGAQSGASDREIKSRYTQTKGDQPDRIRELAGDILNSSDAETNPEKARAIATWLNENKQYSANATHDPERNVVDQFLFEMDSGHTPYFTTSTVVMLREQGIPARVGVGYTEGFATHTEGEFAAGSMNQHTWVEVYTDDGEWVIVDAAPTEDEQAVQDLVIQGNFSATQYGVSESVIQVWANSGSEENGPPGTEYGPGDTDTADGNAAGVEQTEMQPPYNISVSPDPTPGTDVTVTVSKNNTKIHRAIVRFNGEVVGETNTSGQVTAQVPYTDSLTVTADAPGEVDDSSGENDTEPSESLGDRGGALSSADPDDTNESNSSETYTLPTNVSVTSDNVNLPGSRITASFTINGTAVPGVNVYIDGEHVGRTDENGELTTTIPNTVQLGETVTIRVQRDELESTTSIQIAEPEIRVNNDLVALPGSEAEITVVATNNGIEKPIENATVTVFTGDGTAGAPYAESVVSEDGIATVELPWTNALTVTAEMYGTETTTTVTGLYYPLVTILGVLLIGVVGTAVVWWRRSFDIDIDDADLSVPSTTGLQEKFYSLIFGVGEWFRNIGGRISRIGHRISHAIRRFTAERWRDVQQLDLRGFVDGVFSALEQALIRAHEHVFGFIAFLKRLFTSTEDADISENPPDVDGNGNGGNGTGTPSAADRIKEYWRWLVRLVVTRGGKNTNTTVEIGEKAIAHGFPSEPVTRLRVTFQEIQYGDRGAETRVDDAETAVDDLQNTSNGSGEDTI